MKRYSFLLSIFCLTASIPLRAEIPQQEPEELVVYNRILAKVNDKTISVIDVMKKMDMFLQKNYPQFVHSKLARYQLYSSQWRDTLMQMIDQELILTDAEHLEVKVTDAEVREEILNRFGPNTMPILDRMGISYDEARMMIHEEMIVQRMMWFRVNSKALSSVNSLDVKEAYKQFCAKNPPVEEWQYQVLSIRSPEATASEALAKRAFELLQSKLELNTIAETIKTSDEAVSIALSPEVQADEKSISSSHKEVLTTLCNGSYSEPIAQVSRVDNSVVYRIFYLKDHSKKELPIFEKMAENIKEQLLQRAADKENVQYITKLRDRLGYNAERMLETLPQDFQPFAIR